MEYSSHKATLRASFRALEKLFWKCAGRLLAAVGSECVLIVFSGALRAHYKDGQFWETVAQGLFGISLGNAVFGIVCTTLVIVIWAYVELYLEWGSHVIEWKVNDLQPKENGTGYFLGGCVSNGGESIEQAAISLVDFKSPNSNKVPDCRLPRSGAGAGETNLNNGEKFEFWIALVDRDSSPSGYKQTFFIPTAIIGEKDGQLRPQGRLTQGIYEFDLLLTGDKFKARKCHVKIGVSDKDNKEAVKVLEYIPTSSC